MDLRSIVAVAWVGTLAGMAMGAGDSGQGIMAGRADRTIARKAKVSTSASTSERGGAVTQTDSTGKEGSANPLSPAVVCDFVGFPYMDGVNGAYGGGSSASGVSRGNLGVNFTGAVALATWNGTGSPDPAIGYASTGSMILSSSSGASWRGIDFSYCAAAPVTVETYAGVNGSGALLETYTLPANVSGQPYSTWTLRQLQFTALAKSVKMTGTVDRWGVDAIQVTAACSAPSGGPGDGMTCQTAWSTGAGTFRVDTSNATSSPSGNCNAKWYTFVATANGTVAASTCSFFTYDTMLTAYTACDSGYIVRNDDSCGGLGSSISFPVTGGQQYWIALGGWNCQRGQSDLVLSGPIGSLDDCNGNGVSDACEVANGFVADCNGNGVPDSCDLAAGGGVDCNANGTLDSCEIASGAAEDCNGNGVPDSCDIASIPYSGTRSGTLATNGGTVYTTFAGMPVANAPVQFRFEVNADIDYSPAEFVLFTAGGSSQISIQISGAQCGTEIRTLSIPAATYNSARSSNGDLTFAIRTGSQTDSFCANTWRIDVNVAGLAAPDCNLNGRIDTCELADGSAVDQNGNGVPDSCDPYPTLTLTANAAACNAIGSVIDVDARLSGVLNLVVAGQVVLDWDPSKLQLLETNPGDAPYVANYLIDSASGQALILVSSSQGGSGTTAPSAIVSRLKFQVIGGSCDGSGTSVGFGTAAGGFETQFTDGFGTSIEPTLVASAGFVADDGAPVLANVPADVSVQAFAGENGYALVTLGSPTATDGCLSGVTITGTRSDGQALTAAWPSGSTTVTWAAVDACGNASYASTMVTVDPTNTMDLSAAFGGNFAGASRSLSLTMLGGAGTQSRTQSVSIPWGGASSFSVNDLPVDAYTCATIEDPARSLKARVTVSDTGSVWTAAAATMVLGDLINDEVIDVLDWGAYVVSNPAADLNADGFINAVDGNIILANFTRRGDGVCGSSANGPRDPILAITVADVVSMGLPELAGADLNGDGWIDQADIDLGH